MPKQVVSYVGIGEALEEEEEQEKKTLHKVAMFHLS